MQNKTRYLDTMDGYEFEQLCKAIYENSGYNHVELTSKSGDKGRDIIIYTNEGKIVVECKHRPNSSIGRPVIQKLHSEWEYPSFELIPPSMLTSQENPLILTS